jgi:hypothetical protein
MEKTAMRKILTLVIITAFVLTAFSGCKKSSNGNESYLMTANVGSTTFSGSDTYTVGKGVALSVFSYSGVSSGLMPPYMEITMPNFTGEGTYNFDSTLKSNFAGFQQTSSSLKLALSGSVVITASSSSSVSGTFSFMATDGTFVSNGKFTAKRE